MPRPSKPLFSLSLIACAVQAYAQSAEQGAQPIVLDPITVTVTGDRSNEDPFANSSSVRVFANTQFARSGHEVTASEVIKQTVNTVDLGAGNDLPTVRGVDGSGPATGAVAFLAGTRPRLNLSIDGRSATYNELAFGT